MEDMKRNNEDQANVIAPPPLLYASTFLFGLYLDSWLPLRLIPRAARSFVGGALLGIGLTTGIMAIREMRQAGTALQPTKPTTTIIQHGPYRLTRNPIYSAFTLLYAGLALIMNRVWPLLLLPALLRVIRIGVIEREEKYLEKKFGAEYISYKERVPRWL
ncbi:hypothetical protein KSB_34910 [Ktedonobacter robiniae]|uniref:Isoprenylcysteine carboxylmethyltransferase family protein n=2 Tax=Ktedonobacter robiniae TaxID=2778365 RepID=A0ABQ3UQK0_9CHLR|nr:hypothetical protein KSB_34910 [Ktedonobacter robiniae]